MMLKPGIVAGQIPSLTFLRGIAALSVCCFHLLPEVLNNFRPLQSFFSFGYLGLDLFFIISGFVIPYSMYRNSYSHRLFPVFLLKRSIRIEPPYIISFILIILMRIIHASIHHGTYIPDWKQFLLHFLYLNQYFGYASYTNVYWTLAIEFQFYLLIGLLYPFITGYGKKISFIILAYFCSICWFLHIHYNWFIFQYGYLFITGILIFLYTIRYLSGQSFLLLLIAVLILMYFKNSLDVVVTAIIGTLAILIIKGKWKVTEFLGKISFSLYLVHQEAAGWFVVYMQGIVKNELVLRFISLLFAIGFATGFYFLFEKPAFKLSKKIRSKKSSPVLLS